MQLIYLKYVRLRTNRTQQSVARAAGISHKALCDIERGRVNPTADELDRLARELNVPADTLMMPVEVDLPVPPLARAKGYLRPVEEPAAR